MAIEGAAVLKQSSTTPGVAVQAIRSSPARTVSVEIDGSVAIIRVANSPVNALHPAVAEEIRLAAESIGTTAPDARVLILTGTGRHFISGGDIRYFQQLEASTAQSYALEIQRMHDALFHHPLPVIAAINGYALGGGTEVIMACDIRIAEEKAVFGLPEVTLGLIPAAGGTQNLRRFIPLGIAKRMLFTGERLPASEMQRHGLVDEVVADGEALTRAREIAHRISQNAPLAVRAAKQAINFSLSTSLPDGHRLEAILLAELFATSDLREGVNAFLEKRRATFEGK